MILRTILPLCCVALLAPAVRADKFYLGSREAAERMSEGEPDHIEGVLLREEADRYVIRIEGGEIELPKAQVWKVEPTALTVAAIEDREAAAKDRLADQNRERDAMLAAAADAERSRIAAAREAFAERQAAAIEASMRAAPIAPPLAPGFYDPVVDIYRSSPIDYIVTDEIQGQLGGLIRAVLRDDIQQLRDRLRRAVR